MRPAEAWNTVAAGPVGGGGTQTGPRHCTMWTRPRRPQPVPGRAASPMVAQGEAHRAPTECPVRRV